MKWLMRRRHTLVSFLACLIFGALQGLGGRVDATGDGVGGRVGEVPGEASVMCYMVRGIAG